MTSKLSLQQWFIVYFMSITYKLNLYFVVVEAMIVRDLCWDVYLPRVDLTE